MIKVSRLTHL